MVQLKYFHFIFLLFVKPKRNLDYYDDSYMGKIAVHTMNTYFYATLLINIVLYLFLF